MEWISIEDKLPENKQTVLALISYLHDGKPEQIYHVAEYTYYFHDNQIWQVQVGNSQYDLYGNIEGVTHWMPLPEPPKQ